MVFVNVNILYHLTLLHVINWVLGHFQSRNLLEGAKLFNSIILVQFYQALYERNGFDRELPAFIVPILV